MEKKKLPKPARTGLAWWDGLLKEQKYEALGPYFEAGGSNAEIADLHNISGGSVARMRHLRNQRLHPERYDPVTGKPLPKPKQNPKKRAAGTTGPQQWKAPESKPGSKKEEIPRPGPKESFTQAEPRAKEHKPGTSPALKRLEEPDRYELGGKRSPFPLPSHKTGNPDDLTEREIRMWAFDFFRDEVFAEKS